MIKILIKNCKVQKAIYAWANQNKLVLGQLNADDKSNKITAIHALLQVLNINGCISTIDAIGTQTKL